MTTDGNNDLEIFQKGPNTKITSSKRLLPDTLNFENFEISTPNFDPILEHLTIGLTPQPHLKTSQLEYVRSQKTSSLHDTLEADPATCNASQRAEGFILDISSSETQTGGGVKLLTKLLVLSTDGLSGKM